MIKTEEGVIEIKNIQYCQTTKKYFDATVLTLFSQGQQKGGVENGPFSLCKMVTTKFNTPITAMMLPQYKQVSDMHKWQEDYENLYKYLSKQPTYVLIGGDHSCGQSSVAASINKVSNVANLVVIWIDAHADCNTMEASLTKNIHGQPLAGILGFEEPWFEIKNILPTENLLYYGIRDLDQFEVEKINHHNIFNTSTLIELMNKINAVIELNPEVKFHISFDVDALDPKDMKSTGCLVDDGIHFNDVSDIVSYIHGLDKLMAFDIVEFNPHIGSDDELNKSLETIDNMLKLIN